MSEVVISVYSLHLVILIFFIAILVILTILVVVVIMMMTSVLRSIDVCLSFIGPRVLALTVATHTMLKTIAATVAEVGLAGRALHVIAPVDTFNDLATLWTLLPAFLLDELGVFLAQTIGMLVR